MFAGWGLLVWVNWKGNKLANWGFQSGVCWVGLDQSSLLVLVYWEGDLLGWFEKGGLQSGVCKVGYGNWVRFARFGLLNHVCWVGISDLGSLGGGKYSKLEFATWVF